MFPAISRELKAGALLACLCALAPSCGQPTPTPAGGSINIIASSLLATPTTWVRVTLQTPTVLSDPLTIPLMVKGDQAVVFGNRGRCLVSMIFARVGSGYLCLQFPGQPALQPG